MDGYYNYLKAVATVAAKAENGAEACHLISWAKATIPDATGTDYEDGMAILSLTLEYWDSYGAWEDELAPCTSVLHAIAVVYDDLAPLDAIALTMSKSKERHETSNEPWPSMTYEEFCDKYAQELNA